MTPEDFVKNLTTTAEQDQWLAGVRSMTVLVGAFYTGLLAERVAPYDAVLLTREFMRCTVGDHKPEV